MATQTKERVLPDCFDAKAFDEAMDAMATIVGGSNISRTNAHGNLEGPAGELFYGDVWPMGDDTDHTPSGAIRPQTVEEVQAVVKIATQYKLPLWTVSRG